MASAEMIEKTQKKMDATLNPKNVCSTDLIPKTLSHAHRTVDRSA
ncbi:hypothetical protein AGMMS50256_12910 [Betaproteobacteria bacterium]|nr:hypothetical protein AGMMS50256_12910 [Betaproteobacteria bacterium]